MIDNDRFKIFYGLYLEKKHSAEKTHGFSQDRGTRWNDRRGRPPSTMLPLASSMYKTPATSPEIQVAKMADMS